MERLRNFRKQYEIILNLCFFNQRRRQNDYEILENNINLEYVFLMEDIYRMTMKFQKNDTKLEYLFIF